MTPAASTPCIIYCRVSTRDQGDSGLGLDAQEAACREEAERRGWEIISTFREVVSGAKKARPMFAEACELAQQHHGVLLAAKADRVSRGTVASVLALHERANAGGWNVYAVDMPEIDTTSAMGEFILTIMAAVARLERRMISDRTKASMKAAQAKGIHVGRPRTMSDEIIDKLKELRASGLSYERMAIALNDQGIPGSHGGKWHKRNTYLACQRYEVAA